MASEAYPIVSRPEAGTVLYPYRRIQRPRTGRLEAFFIQHLQRVMPEQVQIFQDVCINVSESLPPYYPDIALFVDGRPEIRIDVEIDEPYTIDRKPIHYLSCGDQYRDSLLNRHGWTVVRFAVQQIQRAPLACAEYLERIMRNDDYLTGTDIIPVIPRWTRSEALKMAARGEHFPEEVPSPTRLLPFSEEEKKYKPLVKALPRTEDMTEKMATFTDAGVYAQDQFIDFEPEEHIYTYAGRERFLPVSSLIAYFFEEFDALAAAERKFARYHVPVEEGLDQWDRIGRIASEVGTFVHLQTENWFQRGFFESVCPFTYNGKTEAISVERERRHFLRFVEDYKIRPYRQEWPVYDKALNIAGTIDLICRENDGEFTIYDWKRSGKVVNTQGAPIVEGFGGKRGFNGINLPDTAFYHYCVQQNLYRYMLETHYGIRVKAMNLVVLCPDYSTYYVASVPKMDEVIQQIVSVCEEKDLGHRLLG
jgi:hypothetical protein